VKSKEGDPSGRNAKGNPGASGTPAGLGRVADTTTPAKGGRYPSVNG
jgi:hypothetical protein